MHFILDPNKINKIQQQQSEKQIRYLDHERKRSYNFKKLIATKKSVSSQLSYIKHMQ